MSRKEARELAFAIGFEKLITGDSVEEIIDGVEQIREVSVSKYTASAASGVESHEEELDMKISENTRGWSLKRLSKVVLSILRLAVYEIIYEESVPKSVAINEAVELAKKYGDAEDAPFVNGILSTISKEYAE